MICQLGDSYLNLGVRRKYDPLTEGIRIPLTRVKIYVLLNLRSLFQNHPQEYMNRIFS